MSPSTLIATKELQQGFQPLLLAEFTFADSAVLRLSTHSNDDFPYQSNQYLPRIIDQGIQATQLISSLGADVTPSVTLRLADPDGFLYTNYEANAGRGFEGAKITLTLVFWEVGTANFSTDSAVKFLGKGTSPKITDDELEIEAVNRLRLRKVFLPNVRISRRCPWPFPRTAAERQEAADDVKSRFHRCGYSPDVAGGNARGNNNGGSPFTECDFSRRACDARGMLIEDSLSRQTGSFGGIQFEQVDRNSRSFGGPFELIESSPNKAKYNDFFPLVWGKAWLEPPVMNTNRNANETKFEAVVSQGWIQDDATDMKLVVNDVEIPKSGQGVTAIAGFWGFVNSGTRRGQPNVDPFYEGGDPYGNLAAITATLPRQLADSPEPPSVRAFISGRRVRVYTTPTSFNTVFSRNPVWILLDVLLESGLTEEEIDTQSFIDAAPICDALINYQDLTDTTQQHERFKSALVVRQRRSAADVVRALRNGFRAILVPNSSTGKLRLRIKQTLGDQQPAPVSGSNYNTAVESTNAASQIVNGYVAYKFDDSTIAKPKGGGSRVRVRQRSADDTPNQVTFRFQDEDRGFLDDSATIVDPDALLRAGSEIVATTAIEGVANYDQAKRVGAAFLAEGLQGNPRGDSGGTYEFEWETSVRGLHLSVGDICLFDYSKLNLNDNLESPPGTPISGVLVRIQSIRPGTDFGRVKLRATWHKDRWYEDTFGQEPDPDASGQFRDRLARPPFPWQGFKAQPDADDPIYSDDEYFFGISQEYEPLADESKLARLRVTGVSPINTFSPSTRPPAVPIQGSSASTGGSIEGDKTYWIALCSKDSGGKLSAMSPLVKIEVPAGTNTNTITVNNILWPSSASGYVAFAGLDPNQLTFQKEAGTNPSSVTVTNLNELHWGPPDGEFYKLRIKGKRVLHSGVFGVQITSLTSTTITVADAFWTTNEWANRIVSVVGLDNSAAEVPIASFKIASNTSDTLTLAASQPDPVALGITAGDVIVMRLLGTTVTSNTIQDTKFDNSLALEETVYQVLDATNATPINIKVTGHPFLTGDKIRISLVQGNTAANEIWTITKVDADNFTLDGSAGSAAYTGGGDARRLTEGLDTDAEVGDLIRIIAGKGRGTVAKIVSNTADKYTIEGTWPDEPDSTSIWIVERAAWTSIAESEEIDNATRDNQTTLDLEVANFVDRVMLVLPVGIDGGGAESFEYLSQVREIFVFGEPQAGRQVESLAVDAAGKVFPSLAKSSEFKITEPPSDVVVTAPPFRQKGERFTIVLEQPADPGTIRNISFSSEFKGISEAAPDLRHDRYTIWEFQYESPTLIRCVGIFRAPR